MQGAKEAVSNAAASAKSGMEKTKATIEEKAEKLTTGDPARKEMAEEKRDERYREAECEKQGAYDQNASARWGGGNYGYTAGDGGPVGYSAEEPVREDYPSGMTRVVVGSRYPAGTYTGSGRTGVLDPDRDRDEDRDRDVDDRPGAQDPTVAGGARTGYGSGANYS